MDEPDYPTLDMGDFEVLDECVGEDEDEVISYDGNEEEHINEDLEDYEREKQDTGGNEDFSHADENSGDNADNILDVSIDFEENEFLESVAKDFSENIEEEEERPRVPQFSNKRREPTVQLKKLDISLTKKFLSQPEEIPVPRKKPGPKSKTMNITTPPVKKPIQRITFSDKSEKDDNTENEANSKNESQKIPKNSGAMNQKKTEQNKPNVTPKKSVFLKADLTDEEIMMHFDEIENTVLTSDTFVIQEEVDQAGKNEKSTEDYSSQLNKTDREEIQDEKKNDNEEEDWDKDIVPTKMKTQLKIEQEEFKESELWYKDKLKEKQENLEIKFSRLAGLINYSYPCYKKWLDRNDVLYGTAICKIEPHRHIPLDQLHHNRWKFVCNKKQNQQATREQEENADDIPKSKNIQWGWSVVPGVPDAKLEDTEEYPPFIMRVVKLFGEFLNSLEAENENAKESHDEKATPEENNQHTKLETSQEVQESKENEKKKICIPPDGFVILIRCNRSEDIMMNITGKNISDDFKDRVTDYFLNGSGKDANIKSFYCKSIIKENNVISTDSVLLFGSETLCDTVGSIKIDLPPKANMWANLAGVEVLSNTIIEFLLPTQNTTVLEIGCGSGIMSLLLASKCQKVIGVDIEKEVSEAQTLCNLNGITNVAFLTGKIEIFLKEIARCLEDAKAVAVINTNSVFGKSPKVIKGLRKITTLGRIVLITNLTKLANRIVLELVQPANDTYGNPFIPIKGCIVDTTPKHFAFDIVMSMERRTMANLLKIPAQKGTINPVGLISKSKQEALKKNSENVKIPPFQKGLPAKFARGGYTRGGFGNPPFKGVNKFTIKRSFDDDDNEFEPGFKKFKFDKTWQGSNIRPNPMYDKSRNTDEEDLRARLSSNRLEPAAIVNEISEQKKLLDAAKQKLSGASSSVDNETVKKLQEMLNLAIEKTNKLQNQLPPRSVWDRIAPPQENAKDEVKGKLDDKAAPMRGRLVKETGPKEIVITTANNRGYINRPPVPVGKSKKYGNVPPVEPILLEPVAASNKFKSVGSKPSSVPYHKPGPNRFQDSNYRKPSETWDKGKPEGPLYKEVPGRYIKSSPPRRPLSPLRQPIRSALRQVSPPRRPISPLMRRQPMLSPPRRPASPPRRAASPPRRPLSPPRRPVSPAFRHHSTSSRNVPSGNRQSSSPRRLTPPRRPFSPANRISPPRQKSPLRRYADEWDIPTRGAVNESGWRPEKEKATWDAAPVSNWDQTSSNGNRYRTESSNWDNASPSGPWKGSLNSGPSNWDVKKDPPRDMPRHEPRHGPSQIEPRFEPRHEMRHEQPRRPMSPPRHEPRHDLRHEPPRRLLSPPPRQEPPRRALSPPRHEPRHEPPRRPLSPPRHEMPRHEPRSEPRHEPRWEAPEKNDYDLPEDARDPWDDDHPSTPKWAPSGQPNQSNTWGRDKPVETNWQQNPTFPMKNLSGNGASLTSNMPNQNQNIGMGMNMGMNNQKPPTWQPTTQQTQNRNTNWIPQNNWQASNNSSGVMQPNQSLNLLGNVLNNWQQPQQNFSNFNARPFNNAPFMNNRR
ncbi:uncharacterized protein LOC131664830 isoform X3 [Phymastichus coffea]|uniref:uncharacterized protein LOC131664830 isoform X3 n=1 Tax=Phymastichus coffea TaxID=108790 RepID=UPI00273AAE11|nr:uncharacterized protein LOC131664830 isoform X3 [Phymastichus coffea]